MYHYTYKLNYRFNMNRRKHNDITRTDYESITCSACNWSKVEIRKRVDFLKDYVKKQVQKDLYLVLAADKTLH